MNQSIKAAILSALIFPGVGQISAGYKKRGWTMIAASVALLYLIFGEVMIKANEVIVAMQKQGTALDLESISKASAQISRFSYNTYLNILLISFIILWLFSIIDAYRTSVNK